MLTSRTRWFAKCSSTNSWKFYAAVWKKCTEKLIRFNWNRIFCFFNQKCVRSIKKFVHIQIRNFVKSINILIAIFLLSLMRAILLRAFVALVASCTLSYIYRRTICKADVREIVRKHCLLGSDYRFIRSFALIVDDSLSFSTLQLQNVVTWMRVTSGKRKMNGTLWTFVRAHLLRSYAFLSASPAVPAVCLSRRGIKRAFIAKWSILSGCNYALVYVRRHTNVNVTEQCHPQRSHETDELERTLLMRARDVLSENP